MKTSPLGDQAILVHCDSEEAANLLSASIHGGNPPWLFDVVLAYSSVAIFFDPMQTRYATVNAWILSVNPQDAERVFGKEVTITCCYELGPDLVRVAESKRFSTAEVIALHSSTVYTVYAVGFCPGFPYLGYLPDELSGVPRLDSPRLRVEPGSVGLTGRQTGIYPLPRPGGWNLIGRTPMQLVDLESSFFALAPGDRVRFEPINRDQYERQLGQRPVVAS